MEYPKLIGKWAYLLNMFPDDIAITVGELMLRLSMLVAPLKNDLTEGQIEPDGFDGVSQSGTYERLLLSEWLMSKEIPEEFIRRAVMKEHHFLKLKKRAPHSASFSVVLFDTGPLQLGKPRILHIAILLLLSHRAKLAGAELAWGILQAPKKGLFDEVKQSSISHLLACRSVVHVDPMHIEAWQSIFKTYTDLSEVWVITDKNVRELVTDCHQLYVTEPYLGDTETLDIEYAYRSSRKQMKLELPQQDTLIRILRNPFQPTSSRSTLNDDEVDQEPTLIFSDNGKKLAVSLKDGSIACYSIPNSIKEKMGRPKYFKPATERKIIALSIKKKRFMVISKSRDKLFFDRFPLMPNGNAVNEMNLTQEVHRGDRNHTIYPFTYDTHNKVGTVWLVDAKGSLRSMQWCPRPTLFKTKLHSVLTLIRTETSVHAVTIDQNTSVATLHKNLTLPKEARKTFEWRHIKANSLAFSYYHNYENLIALQRNDERWTINHVHLSKTVPLDVPAGHNVIGLLACLFPEDRDLEAHNHQTAYLVTLDENKKSITFISEKGQKRISAKGKITHACVCQVQPFVAYKTETGDLCVYAANRDAHVLHLVGRNTS